MSPHKSLIAILMALFFIALPISSNAEYGTSPAPQAPDGCIIIDQEANQARQKTYEDMYQKTWQALEKRYFFRENMGNWSQWQHKFDGRLKTLTDTEAAIRQMIESLKDPYTFFLNGKETQSKDVESKQTGIVSYELLDGHIGYIKVRTFNSKNTAREIEEALTKLKLLSATSIIIDLQENRGGYIDEAIHAASCFLDEGDFVTTEDQDSPTQRSVMHLVITKQRYTSVATGLLSERHAPAISSAMPIVILVDKGTASASEMLAGCLQEHKRAILVGQVTLGKGVCQELESLPNNTTLRYTYARWTLPISGKCVHKVGLTPDVVLPTTKSAKDAAVNLLKQERSKHDTVKP